MRVGKAETFLHNERTVNLVLTSPPDLSETSYGTWEELFRLYEKTLSQCAAVLSPIGMIAIVITDRKWKGTLVRKHEKVTRILEQSGMALFLHKILVRRKGVDLYRPSFSHVLCFRRGGRNSVCHRRVKRYAAFQKDVWGPYEKPEGLRLHRNSFHPLPIKWLIERFSNPGDIVLDPFCGTGLTLRVAICLGRKATGYEADTSFRKYWRSVCC